MVALVRPRRFASSGQTFTRPSGIVVVIIPNVGSEGDVAQNALCLVAKHFQDGISSRENADFDRRLDLRALLQLFTITSASGGEFLNSEREVFTNDGVSSADLVSRFIWPYRVSGSCGFRCVEPGKTLAGQNWANVSTAGFFAGTSVILSITRSVSSRRDTEASTRR